MSSFRISSSFFKNFMLLALMKNGIAVIKENIYIFIYEIKNGDR